MGNITCYHSGSQQVVIGRLKCASCQHRLVVSDTAPTLPFASWVFRNTCGLHHLQLRHPTFIVVFNKCRDMRDAGWMWGRSQRITRGDDWDGRKMGLIYADSAEKG